MFINIHKVDVSLRRKKKKEKNTKPVKSKLRVVVTSNILNWKFAQLLHALPRNQLNDHQYSLVQVLYYSSLISPQTTPTHLLKLSSPNLQPVSAELHIHE